ncbi:hypothetical protein K461DRAFT_292763 [Myriangium duriaei CBS 260.36]|uniref:Ubiquitin-like domain-containing protein n=1 Tax=Myriangium duriaei CBS 260.36 TaxID=1168546 RepID=A0A9P4J3W6_9PEZI|nr:hypothetical protein K461DRAFT_292763 [Myriangium duriaei CBS 260.36]
MDPSRQQPSAHNPVDLVIRFTTSVPDLILSISRPDLTSTLTLKQLIRPHLPPASTSARLRLISAGKVLLDPKPLSSSITIPPPPPPDAKGKGKSPFAHPRVYIHCSISDPLDPSDLAAETTSAAAADAALLSVTTTTTAPSSRNSHVQSSGATRTAPRGFDRLLTAGFSAAEVATLRAQFMAIQAHSHTPDTMPTGDALRALEDRWLDNDASAAGAGGTGGEGGDGLGAEDGGLEDMLWGNLMGFFWPVAAVCWLMREEGVWSRRRQIAVLSGMLVNVTFGFLRLTS